MFLGKPDLDDDLLGILGVSLVRRLDYLDVLARFGDDCRPLLF
ncbi:hypothetical protein [Halovenus salina]|uniref:Uncharacterized protein n=1 Tax=Halovenus salina TaxID=1510225 RepID=A0ABD5W5Q0_9EURY